MRLERRLAVLASWLLALLVAAPASAELAIEARLGAGVLAGRALEIVFDTGEPRAVLSRLEWPLLPAALVTTAMDIRAGAGFAASFAVASGLPTRTGTMTDRDYLNGDGEVTHFSSHVAALEGALLVDLRGGWRFALGASAAIEPYVALSFARLAWVARDGYLQYPPEYFPPFTPWDPVLPRVDVYGIGIRYEQTTWYPAVGAAAVLRLLEHLELRVSLAAAPYVLCRDVDNHYFRGVEFHARFAGGFAVEPALAATWTIAPRASLRLDLAFRHVGGLVGDSWDIGTGVDGWDVGAGDRSAVYVDGAGAGSSYLRAAAALAIAL